VTSVADVHFLIKANQPTVYPEDGIPQIFYSYLQHVSAQLTHYQGVRYKLTSGRHKYDYVQMIYILISDKVTKFMLFLLKGPVADALKAYCATL
jgi:hypothetical protein